MKFFSFAPSLLVFFDFTIFEPSQSQPTCLSGDEANEFNNRLIEEHNKYRSCHGVPSLVADNALMQDSIEWSEKMSLKNNLEHSLQRKNGENLAYKFISSGMDVSEWNPVKPWYDEIKDYRGGFSSETGHYTQVVWKTTQKVGCGICSTFNSTAAFATCRYFPPGNVIGQFEENVPRRRSNCEAEENNNNEPSDSTEKNDVSKDQNLSTIPVSNSPTSHSKYTEDTSSTNIITTVKPKPSWDMEKTLIFIAISTHVILALIVVITLSVLGYYYAISYYRL